MIEGPLSPELLNPLIAAAPAEFDLTDQEHLAKVGSMADTLGSLADADALGRLEAQLLTGAVDTPMMLHLAAKMARSRALLHGLPGATHVSVVFAVYKEHERILSRSEHPHGENFLVRKLEQLRWLFDGRDDLTWDLTVVDDGCPLGSGRIAERILAEQEETHRARVLFLADAIEQRLPITGSLRSTDDSRKGGSIELGMWNAVRTPRGGHVVVYTDADLSTHLGQIGLLVEPIVRHGRDAAIGTRRAPTSVVLKRGARNVRGKLFIYLWKRLLPELGDIVDTQCGFKAFAAPVIAELVESMAEKGFAFDIELLLRTALRKDTGGITTVPIAWIDSEAASTTTDLQPYRSMLQSVVRTYRSCLPPNPDAEGFAAFLDELDEERWQRLQDRVPPEIAERDPAGFGTWSEVSADDLRAAIQG